MIALLFLLLFIFVFIGFPIGIAIGLASLSGIVIMDEPLFLIVTRMFSGLDSFVLLAVPYFILAGFIMTKAGIVKRIIDFSNALVGNKRGGLAHVTVVASMLFAGVSGSGVADAAALGSVLIPAMKKQGYDDDFSTAVTCSSSVIGPIIPPSIPMILYGIYTSTSIGALFLGGFLPGILIGIGLMLCVEIISIKRNYNFKQGATSLKRIFSTFLRSFGALVMPLIIIVGIVGGVFTPTEAGAVAVVYGLIFGLFFSKDLKLKDLPNILVDAAVMVSIVMLIISTGTIFSNLLSRLLFQRIIVGFILSIANSPIFGALLVMIMLLFLGLFIDTTVLIIMFAPILTALGSSFGFDPIHWGVVIIITMIIGAITPPVGNILFITCSIAKVRVERVIKILIPFLLVLVIVNLLCLFFPPLVTFIPDLFFK